MLACVDVAYGEGMAIAGCLLFEAWTDERPTREVVVRAGTGAPYRSGQFYLRELPAIRAVLGQVDVSLGAVVVDGYVWLGSALPGLGAHLHDALGGRVAVVGVAKNAWGPSGGEGSDDARRAIPVRRGRSDRPLYVTAAGMDVLLAASLVAGMHGEHRMPTLLKAVDRLVRQG
jgi:deoxyribonuclease V